MSILSVSDMTQGFGDKTIFNNVSFKLLRGEHIGLVGANGEGKTTFLRLITGEILPDDGEINWNSKVSIGYLDQNVELHKYNSVNEVLKDAYKDLYILENRLEKLYLKMSTVQGKELDKILNQSAKLQEILDKSDYYSIDSKVEGIANGLGIRNLLSKNPNELSGGQRTKVLLAKLLLEKPDILLLDEPTNHLDEENIEWLKSYLNNYENAFILISHDLEFLNSVINVVYLLEHKTLTRYPGNYEKFMMLYEERKKDIEIQYIKQQKEIEKLEEYIRKNKVRTATARQAKSREKKLDKIVRIEIDKNKPKPHFDFKFSRASGGVIFETKDLVIGYDKPLTKPLNLKMKRGEKIAITGANGIGKTTLLKSLINLIQPISGEIKLGYHLDIGYFEQEIKDYDSRIVLDELLNEYPDLNRTQVRRILARCGLTNDHINSQVGVLSGGEQAKVRLCKLINKETNLLILDEPTNHLDKDAKEELKRAIKEYEGSVIIVSHEVEFYQDIATKVWNCEDWTVKTCGSTRKK